LLSKVSNLGNETHHSGEVNLSKDSNQVIESDLPLRKVSKRSSKSLKICKRKTSHGQSYRLLKEERKVLKKVRNSDEQDSVKELELENINQCELNKSVESKMEGNNNENSLDKLHDKIKHLNEYIQHLELQMEQIKSYADQADEYNKHLSLENKSLKCKISNQLENPETGSMDQSADISVSTNDISSCESDNNDYPTIRQFTSGKKRKINNINKNNNSKGKNINSDKSIQDQINNTNNNSNNTNTNPKVIKPPPIIVKGVQDQSGKTIGYIKSTIKNYNGTLVRVTSNNATVYPYDIEQHKNLFENFKDAKLNCYTYNYKNQRPKVMILRGIHQETSTEEIKKDLTDKGLKIINIYNIYKFVKDVNGDGKQVKLPCFTVILEHNTNISEILGIIGCCGYKVSWETKRKQSVTQCRRCQAFGHVSSCCNLQYHCVKCSKSHVPGECPRNNDNTIPLKCFNCGDDHVASSQDCPERKNYVSRLNGTFNNNNKNSKYKHNTYNAPKLFNSNYQNKEVSFANLFDQNQGSSFANKNSEQIVRQKLANPQTIT